MTEFIAHNSKGKIRLFGSGLIYGARRSRRFTVVMQKDAEAG
jgi:hypothetical protein